MSLKKAKKKPTDLTRISSALGEAIVQIVQSQKIEQKGASIQLATMEISGTDFDVVISFIPKAAPIELIESDKPEK